MEKKTYIAPYCEVVEITIENHILTGSYDEEVSVSDAWGDDFELESNRRRGQWGNLWSE